jgi:hypothetical protein
MSFFNKIPALVLFENLDKKGYYMLFLCSPETAKNRYEQYTRTGRYDETGMKEPYGYPELNISKPVTTQLPVDSERQAELFLSFIKANKVSDHVEIKQASSWGWFNFSEGVCIEKWLEEFKVSEEKKQQEYIKANNKGVQTALF